MIVITTPTGAIGQRVLASLVESDEALRVIVRDTARLPEHVRERVEVVQGSHGDTDVVRSAFDGVDAVFWLCPPNPSAESVEEAYVKFTSPAADAFRSQGVPRVVGVSARPRHAVGSERWLRDGVSGDGRSDR